MGIFRGYFFAAFVDVSNARKLITAPKHKHEPCRMSSVWNMAVCLNRYLLEAEKVHAM